MATRVAGHIPSPRGGAHAITRCTPATRAVVTGRCTEAISDKWPPGRLGDLPRRALDLGPLGRPGRVGLLGPAHLDGRRGLTRHYASHSAKTLTGEPVQPTSRSGTSRTLKPWWDGIRSMLFTTSV